ncbi:MAG: voltage-gated chloride channel protein [Fusobacteriales bacterium]|nr:MAG: voltage-gated chloride channel protein [Fusobacteriales bacterium]
MLKKYLKFIIMILFVAVFIGTVTALFSKGLHFTQHIKTISNFNYFLFFLPFAGLLTLYSYDKIAPNYDKGMGILLDNLDKKSNFLNYKMGILVFSTTLLAHLFGASVGREGVAVQLGGVIGKKNSKFIEEDRGIFSRISMACGFAGLYQTPLAAIFFIYEITKVKEKSKREKILYFLVGLVATFLSKYTAKFLGAHTFLVNLKFSYNLINLNFIFKILFALICFSFIGILFVQFTEINKRIFTKLFPNKYVKIFSVSVVVALALHYFNGRYMSLGTNLINESFSMFYLIKNQDFILKLIFTSICISIGFQGGEVTPLFAIGASLGIFLSYFLGIDPLLLAALGYICVFSSATHGYLGSSFIGAEIFGFEYFPIFFISCFITSRLNFHKNIYGKRIYEVDL